VIEEARSNERSVVHLTETGSLRNAPLVERLRRVVGGATPTVRTVPSGSARPNPTSAGSFFGPSVTIGEVLAYLIVALALCAWIVLLAVVAQPGVGLREVIVTGGLSLAAVVMFRLGVVLKVGDSRPATRVSLVRRGGPLSD
jgi:hypothetical protein